MKNLSYFLLYLATVCGCPNVIATTYYIDATNGNDGWSGTTSAVSAANGPWQSIAKVNAAFLKPGDQVLFSCGKTWSETLKPSGSGRATAKIFFGSYPSQCADKPKISGFRSLAGDNWQPYQGNIWKTTFPQNLIFNGSLSSSIANWSKWPSDAKQTFNSICPLSVAGCMDFFAGTSANSSLANSNPFPVAGGKKYALTMSFYAPSDTSANLIVYENGNSYHTLGLDKKITGNDQWQTVNVAFTATQTLANARLGIELPKTKRIYIQSVRLHETGAMPKPGMVLFDGDPVTISHHPNAGHDISRPDSVYLRTAAASPIVKDSKGRESSSQIVAPDLKLPKSGSIDPGTKMMLRSVNWDIKNHTVTGITANTLSITPNTSYLPLKAAGWGFYFYDALWMLDSPGEWYFDNTAQTLYLWTPTNENPGNKVSIATLDTAIDFSGRSNLTVDNLEIDGASTGLDIVKSVNITLQNLDIHNIDENAIRAEFCKGTTISTTKINRVAVNGIRSDNSTNVLIQNNALTEVGIFVKAGKRISLPMQTALGISLGSGSIVLKNTFADIAGVPIHITLTDNKIDSNIIQRSCLTVNDCGAIYVMPSASKNTVIQKNLILEAPGDIDGTPDGTGTATNGIYLDEGASRILVTGNTVKGATYAIHLHNGGQNTLRNNILYGSERSLIFQQETDKSSAIAGNIITKNQLFPSTPSSVAIFSHTIFDNVENFATYDYNHYSTLYSPLVAKESGRNVPMDYTFKDWQIAKTANGKARNNDINSDITAPLPSFAQGIAGPEIMVNGDFSAGLKAWSSWNAVAPRAVNTLEGCLPVSVNCMHVIAGASDTLVNSPAFPVIQGKFYRISFDLKSSVDKVKLYPLVRIAGPSNYNSLIKEPPKLSTSINWERHSLVFEATATASNPAISDQGARFDIGGLPSGQSLWIANLEIAPFDPGTFGLPKSDLLVNMTGLDKAIDCPARLTDPGLCSSYVNFPEGTITAWPISVPARSGRIVFTQNMTLPDSDGDGIADSQDDCEGTAKGLAVNGRGCSL